MFSAIATAIVCFSCLAVGQDSADVRVTADIDAAIRATTRDGFSGAVLIASGDHILLDETYGSIAGARLTASSKFWIASIAKQFTSAAILKCQDRGLLRLADPISKYVPQAPPDKAAITLLQLLTHQSGFPQNYVADEIEDRSAAVAAILSQPLERPPGTAFGYSNDNYALAAAIVELVTHKRFEDFVRKQLLQPAGLAATGFAATAEAKSVTPARRPRPARLSKRQWGGLGSGAMFSTTHDLYSWYRALRNEKVFTRPAVDEFFTPHVKIQEGASGLGWFLANTEKGSPVIFTRGNDDWGPNGLIYAYPDRQIVVLVLSHAGQKDEDTSWSRAVLKIIEERLRL
ncbi:MAG: serine hydrolase domain-containing protein [Terriglobales bacterium]